MFKNLMNFKKHSNTLARLIATVQLKENGVECHFDNASEAIEMRASRSEILEALDKDVSKSAEVLFNAQPIIGSIKDGRVREFDSIYNTIEDVFGATYDKIENTITLCGVSFEVGAVSNHTRVELKALILKGIFGIERKELVDVLKTLVKYEETKNEYEKAILYPSTILADKIIAKVVAEDVAFSNVRKTMTHEERAAFDATFSRTGIDGVIQNSSFVNSDGVQQIAPSHKQAELRELSSLLNGNTKYVEAVEIDGDGDVAKMTSLVKQVERFQLNASFKFTMKARKLGNYSAIGLFMQSQLLVAVDVRTTAAVLHELAHLVHLVDFADDAYVNYLIAKLTPMVCVPDELSSKTGYYQEPTEVVARACEIGALFAREEGDEVLNDDDGFAIIKHRDFYENLSGIYFDFHTFDEKTKQELIGLYKLFFKTAHGAARPSGIDNFIKIDTNYVRVEKEKSYRDFMREAAERAEKELRALYSLVNADTIDLIFKNRKSVSAEVLAMKILSNISFCGNHAKKMTVDVWAEVVEDKAAVVSYIVNYIQNNVSKKEWISFLVSIRKNGAWDRVKSSVLLGGFSDKARRDIKKALVAKESLWHEQVIEFNSTVMKTNPAAMIDAEMIQDEEFVLSVIDNIIDGVTALDASLVKLETLVKWNRRVLESKNERRFYAWLIHPALTDHLEFMDECISHDKMVIGKASERYRNDAVRMKNFFDKYGYSSLMVYLGSELKDNTEFARPIVEENDAHLEFFTQKVKDELARAGEVDLFEVELKKIQASPANTRCKVAKTTTDPRLLDILAKDKNQDIRGYVAGNTYTVAGTLMDLAKLKAPHIKAAVASNPNTPKPILDQMMKLKGEEYVTVFEHLARNPKMELADLKKILKMFQEYRYVKWNILCNPNILNYNHKGKLTLFKEVVSGCMKDEEEAFNHEMRVHERFTPSKEFLQAVLADINAYIGNGYTDVYSKLFGDLMGGAISAQISTEKEAVQTAQPISVAQTSEDPAQDFEALIEQGEIVAFERTDGKGVEDVLRIKSEIEDFKSFNQWLIKSKRGYYSRFAKGFILYPEFAKELKQKLQRGTQAAASVAASLYTADMLQTFANGTLF